MNSAQFRKMIEASPIFSTLTEPERTELLLAQRVLHRQAAVDFRGLPNGVSGLLASLSPGVRMAIEANRSLLEELDQAKRYRPFQTKVDLEERLADHPDRDVLKKVASRQATEELSEALTETMNDKSAGIYRKDLHGVSLRDCVEHGILREAIKTRSKPLTSPQPEPQHQGDGDFPRGKDVELAFLEHHIETGVPGAAIASGTGLLPVEDQGEPGSLRASIREAMDGG